MSFSTAMLGMIAALPLAQGIAFGGPAPTAVSADRALEGFTPKPTKGPSIVELRRRQTNLFPETCGWVDGDYSSGVTCSIGRTCVLYTASDVPGMAGCCDGSDTQECGWANSCVNYDDYWSSSSCDSDCESNTFIRKCSKLAAPYCVTWTYPSDNIADFGCADYDAGIETVLQIASDSSDTTSMTLPTISGDAVTGWDGSSSTDETTSTDESTTDSETTTDDTIFPNFTTETTTDDPLFPTDSPSNTTPSSSKTKKKKGVSVGAIAGAVVGGLIVLFLIIAAVIFFCVKKKKSAQLAQNQAAVAAAQANRPQSQYPPQQPNMMPPPQMAQQQPPVAPMSPPQPGYQGYFVPHQDQKINPQTQVHEYGAQSPISNPSTPAPAYVAPYYADANAPPMPTQSPGPYGAREPTPGTHEVDAISAARPPQAQSPAPPAPQGPVFEMGQGK